MNVSELYVHDLISIYSLHTGCCAPCKVELDTLVHKKRREFYINSKKRASVYKSISSDRNPAPGWKPRGVLVAHLHEHQVKIYHYSRN